MKITQIDKHLLKKREYIIYRYKYNSPLLSTITLQFLKYLQISILSNV